MDYSERIRCQLMQSWMEMSGVNWVDDLIKGSYHSFTVPIILGLSCSSVGNIANPEVNIDTLHHEPTDNFSYYS